MIKERVKIAALLAGGVVVGFVVKKFGKDMQIHLYEKKMGRHPGNTDQYGLDTIVEKESVLKGKRIAYLGSSVTYGAAAQGVSFADYITKMTGSEMIKEAVSGTTLTDHDASSYVSRLKTIDANEKIDLFVVQLSTNDASRKKPLGQIEKQRPFDTETITGAIQELIAYIKEIWKCPVMFYTNAYYDNENYAEMVKRLYELQKSYPFGIIDLYTDDAFNAIGGEDRKLYMADPIHPTKAGYLLWWTPEIEKQMSAYMTK